MSVLSNRETNALRWLATHGGDAGFDKHGVALAQGEQAPVYRVTWNKLQAVELIEFYGGKRHGGSGYGRLRLTDLGRTKAATFDPDRRGCAHAKQPRRPLMVDDDPSDFFA